MPAPGVNNAADCGGALITPMRISGAVVRPFFSAKEMRDGEQYAHAQAARLDKSLSK
jgi:hypothetical protein